MRGCNIVIRTTKKEKKKKMPIQQWHSAFSPLRTPILLNSPSNFLVLSNFSSCVYLLYLKGDHFKYIFQTFL